MNLTLLRAFHLVATTGGFTRAAQAAGVSQPTLSAQVRALEAAHQTSLFARKGRRTSLTPLGQSLFAITTRLFEAEGEAEELLSGARTLLSARLRVAADSATHAMPALAALRRRRAGVTFSLTIGNSTEVVQAVHNHDADVGVTARQTSDPRLHSIRLRTDELTLFAPRTHLWAKRKQVLLQEIGGCELVLRERGSVTRERFEAELAARQIRPGAILEAQTREAVREAVAAGFGVGVIFASEMGDDPLFRAIRIADADLTVEEYAICLEERRRTPLVRAFFEAAAETARMRESPRA